MPTENRGNQGGIFAALQLAWHLGYIIALPVALFGFGGAYLDRTIGTSPLFLLLGFGLAILISGIGVLRKVREVTGSLKNK